ncbi:helix-turn-helix domain-containing protein [Brevundimonas sp. TWP2-3-2]|uniref:helix-turn-helix domain-containing protein n=1 Tax=unclassified Brevundimonas TaxID=2622653 RepID=UPI003CF48425
MTPEVCRACRSYLAMSQKSLALAAHLSSQTVADFERGARTPHPNNISALLAVFEGAGIKLRYEDGSIVSIELPGEKQEI